MVGPILEKALVGTDHLLYLKPEGISYLQSLVPRLIDSVVRDCVIAPPTPPVGVPSSSTHQVCLVSLYCLCITYSFILTIFYLFSTASFKEVSCQKRY